MFFNISLKIGIVLNIVALLSNVALCLTCAKRIWREVSEISIQCRWIGLLYTVMAWFMGEGTVLSSGRNTYEEVAYWMSIFSVGWITVFIITLVAKIWSDGDKLTKKSLSCALIYFAVAYLVH